MSLALALWCLAQTTVWASVTLQNGTLTVTRSGYVVALQLDGSRPYRVTWGYDGTLAAAAALRARASLMPTDTTEDRHTITGGVGGTVTMRCAPSGCWVTITHRDKAGYWRPRPDFSPLLLRRLAAALDAARANSGTPWMEDLR